MFSDGRTEAVFSSPRPKKKSKTQKRKGDAENGRNHGKRLARDDEEKGDSEKDESNEEGDETVKRSIRGGNNNRQPVKEGNNNNNSPQLDLNDSYEQESAQAGWMPMQGSADGPSDEFEHMPVIDHGAGKRPEDNRNRRDDLTDLEADDEVDYTLQRRTRKEERYGERKMDRENTPNLQDLPGNREFIRWFDSYARKECKGDTASKMHKYTRPLFTAADSWLASMTEEVGTAFRLVHLVDWSSNSLRLPQDPQRWIDSVPNETFYGGKR